MPCIVPASHHFNSHAHVERDFCTDIVFVSKSHFNSHAHVERDRNASAIEDIKAISTHTLTWSVTVKALYLLEI